MIVVLSDLAADGLRRSSVARPSRRRRRRSWARVWTPCRQSSDRWIVVLSLDGEAAVVGDPHETAPRLFGSGGAIARRLVRVRPAAAQPATVLKVKVGDNPRPRCSAGSSGPHGDLGGDRPDPQARPLVEHVRAAMTAREAAAHALLSKMRRSYIVSPAHEGGANNRTVPIWAKDCSSPSRHVAGWPAHHGRRGLDEVVGSVAVIWTPARAAVRRPEELRRLESNARLVTHVGALIIRSPSSCGTEATVRSPMASS